MRTDAQACVARGRAYDLLGDLFRVGPERLQHLAAVQALAPFVPERVDDDVRAAWHGLFANEVTPVASAFLEPSGCLGGDLTAALWDAMRAGGFVPSTEPDHLGTQLAYLSWLAGAEADAWRDGEDARAQEISDRARAFLADHVLTWLGALVVAVQSVDAGLYGAAAGLVYELASDHAGAVPVTPRLAPRQDVVGDAKTGLRQISDWLARPARSGVLLAPAVLTRIARSMELPRGFGNRGRLVENLLHAGVHHGRLPELLQALDAELLAAERRHLALRGGAVWAERLRDTRRQLVTVRQAA